MKRKSILYVGNDLQYFIMHRFSLAVAARDAGYDVHAALPGGDARGLVQDCGIRVHAIPIKRGGLKPLSDVLTMRVLCRMYRSLEPDIVHHHTIKPVIYGGIAARLAGQKAVVSGVTGLGHVFVAHGAGARMRRKLIERAYRLALAHPRSRVIFQNRDDMQIFLQGRIVPPEQARLIRGSGVDLGRFRLLPEQSDRMTVTLVSRMLWNKGIGDFVEAAANLKSRGFETRFLLVGDADESNPDSIPKKQMRRWHESGVVEWTGWVEDMPAVYESANVVCLPSRYGEGVPRSLIEAAACGRPIVTTDSPGCREIVRHGENGYLVPMADSKSLVDALEKLISNPDLRRAMGLRGRAIAETEFSSDRVIHETFAVYDELLR